MEGLGRWGTPPLRFPPSLGPLLLSVLWFECLRAWLWTAPPQLPVTSEGHRHPLDMPSYALSLQGPGTVRAGDRRGRPLPTGRKELPPGSAGRPGRGVAPPSPPSCKRNPQEKFTKVRNGSRIPDRASLGTWAGGPGVSLDSSATARKPGQHSERASGLHRHTQHHRGRHRPRFLLPRDSTPPHTNPPGCEVRYLRPDPKTPSTSPSWSPQEGGG